jgi:tetratricopeptide (TPR) repeat protein
MSPVEPAGALADGAVAATAQAARAPISAVRQPAGPARLVGRAHELSMLHGAWRMSASGHPGLVLVRGDAGVGKSRLVAEVAEVARSHGALVAATQCFGTPGRVALAPVADWLRNPAVRSAMSSLDPAWRAEVNRLVPSGTGQNQATASSRAMVDAWQRHQFFEGMARALTCAGRPTLLIIDNLQWCDEETLALLAFTLRLDPTAPILVSATLRHDGPEDVAEHKDWIVQMRASGLLTELVLAPLDVADTARLAEQISGRSLRAADVTLLHATTGGFPLYIVEAVRAEHDLAGGTADPRDGLEEGQEEGRGERPGSGPRNRSGGPVGDLTAVLRNRLGQVSPAAREVAGLASAVGTDFTLDLLTEASDLDADAVVEAVDELWRRRIVREFRAGYDFSHDLLRDAAYAEVSPPKRWLLHRRIAQGLELLHPDGAGEVAAQLAEQYARGGRPERAVTYYRRAADVAAGLFAHAEAIRLHKKALSVTLGMPPGRNRDARELGILEAIAAPLNARYGYASRELERTARRSIELGQALGRKDSTLAGLAALQTSQFVQGRTADSYRTGLRAMALAEPGSRLSGYAHFGVGGSALSLGRPAEALHHLELAGQEAGGAMSLTVGTRPDVHSTAWKAHAHWLLGDDQAALAACRQALAMGRSIDHPYSVAVALAYGCITYQMCGLTGELDETARELRELCERYHFAYYREWALTLTGWLRGGENGVAAARQGVANLRAEGSLTRMPYWLSLLADLLAESGDRDAARAALDAALITGQSHDDVWWLPEVIRMRAGYDKTPEAALARLRAAAELASAHGSVALLRRCERDIEGRGVRVPAAGVRPGS